MTLEAPPWSPDCMDTSDWTDWQRFNAKTGGGRAQRPCADCPASFAAEMRAVGRCNGTPGGDDMGEGNGITTIAPVGLPRVAVTGRELHQAKINAANQARAEAKRAERESES